MVTTHTPLPKLSTYNSGPPVTEPTNTSGFSMLMFYFHNNNMLILFYHICLLFLPSDRIQLPDVFSTGDSLSQPRTHNNCYYRLIFIIYKRFSLTVSPPSPSYIITVSISARHVKNQCTQYNLAAHIFTVTYACGGAPRGESVFAAQIVTYFPLLSYLAGPFGDDGSRAQRERLFHD